MEPTDITIEILKGIREETRRTNASLQETNERLDAMNDRLGHVETGLAALEKATVDGFVAVTARLENIRDFAGDRYRDHEARLQRLEKRVDEIETPPRRT